MTISDDIRTAVKSEKAIIGYRETSKFLKSGGKVKEVVISNNIPENMDKDIRANTKAADVKLQDFDGTSKDLGTACGKPFPVAVMIIKG